MITILVPVLGRAQAIHPLAESIRVSTTVEHGVVFLCSPNDPTAKRCAETGWRTEVMAWAADAGDWAKKINWAVANLPVGEFCLLGATDLRFHPGWDEAALSVAEETGRSVIGTNDLGNSTVMAGKHSTHPFVRTSYVEEGTWDEKGKLLHEGYAHQWVDTELVETAIVRGQWAFAFNSHVEHLHPLWKKGEMDSTYDKALSTSYQDHQVYLRRRKMWRGRR